MIHWQSFSDFLAMGGYGGYVWTSFGTTVLIMALEPLLVRRRARQTFSRLKRKLSAEAAASTETGDRSQ